MYRGSGSSFPGSPRRRFTLTITLSGFHALKRPGGIAFSVTGPRTVRERDLVLNNWPGKFGYFLGRDLLDSLDDFFRGKKRLK